MFNYFKTKLSFHHPFEKIITSNFTNYLKHPIDTGLYENKICFLGNIAGLLLLILFVIRGIYDLKYDIYSTIIYFIMLFSTLLLNINSFIYMLPIFIYDYFLLKKYLIWQ